MYLVCLVQVFLHGSRMEAQLIAVVVPTPAHLQQARASGATDYLRALARDLLASLRVTARLHGVVKPYEVPAAVIVELEPWTVDNGALSAIGKLARGVLDAKFRVRWWLHWNHMTL